MNGLKKLYDNLVQNGTLKSDAVKSAFMENDRADFVPPMFLDDAYYDGPLPLGEGQTISQPTTVVFMLELLQVQEGNVVLDIGAGSGWATALLAHLAEQQGKVVACEINKTVAAFGIENLKKYGYKNVDYRVSDYRDFLKSLPDLDRIISGASFSEQYDELVAKLKSGGRMVVPTASHDIRLITKDKSGNIREEVFPGFMFVPIVHNRKGR